MRERRLVRFAVRPAQRGRHVIGFKCHHHEVDRAGEMPRQNETELRRCAAMQEAVAGERRRLSSGRDAVPSKHDIVAATGAKVMNREDRR